MMSIEAETTQPDMPDRRAEAAVLSSTFCRCVKSMGLSETNVGRLLNVQANVAARVREGSFQLRRSEEDRWNRAALLVDLYKALWKVFSDDTEIKRWLSLYNSSIGDSPLSWIETSAGLEKLIDYVRSGRCAKG